MNSPFNLLNNFLEAGTTVLQVNFSRCKKKASFANVPAVNRPTVRCFNVWHFSEIRLPIPSSKWWIFKTSSREKTFRKIVRKFLSSEDSRKCKEVTDGFVSKLKAPNRAMNVSFKLKANFLRRDIDKIVFRSNALTVLPLIFKVSRLEL